MDSNAGDGRMIDTDKYEGQIEFDYVLKEIEVGVDISEGNYDILRYYRDEYKDLLTEIKRLRKELKEAKDVIQYALEMSNDDDSTRVFEDYLEVIE